MQKLKINVSLIDKSALFKGSKGTYCDITLMDNKDGTDQYGNDGFAVQDVGKERREAGEKGPIIGNWKYAGQAQSRPVQKSLPPAPTGAAQAYDDGDSIPF